MEAENTTQALFYQKNKPLVHSILMAVFYALFIVAVPHSQLFLFMFFLPGITFPVTTSYYKKEKESYHLLLIITHILVSTIIYFMSVMIFLQGDASTGIAQWALLPVFAGFLGSFFYLISVNLFLNKQIDWLRLFLTALLSGMAFVLVMLERRGWITTMQDELTISLSVFFWTVINGWLLNNGYRKAYFPK